MQKKQLQTVSWVVLAIIIGIFILFAVGKRSSESTTENHQKTFADEGDIKTGTVTSVSNKILSIQTDNNITYWFSTDRQTNFGYENESLGDTVSIEYEGEYTDFMLAKSISLINKAKEDNTTIPYRISSSLNENTRIYLTAGVVTDITKNYLTLILNDENDEIITVNKNESTTTDDSISIGDFVRIYYIDFSGSNPRALDIKVISPKPETLIRRSAKKQTVHYIMGTVLTSEDKTIMITKDNYSYRIEKSDNIISDDVQTGDTVRIYHTGNFIDGIIASYIEIID